MRFVQSSLIGLKKEVFIHEQLLRIVNALNSLEREYWLRKVPKCEKIYQWHSPPTGHFKNDVTLVDSFVLTSRQLLHLWILKTKSFF